MNKCLQVIKAMKSDTSKKVAVGVDGSSSSIALASMLRDIYGKDKVVAFTVCQQHGIPNVIRSINEAMQRIGVEHSLLTAVNDNLPTASLLKDGSRRSVFSMKKFNLSSHGNEPVSKSRRNRAARAQMLLILADACNSHDIDTIYFGSTRERQATMVLSRLVRSNHYSLLSCLPVIAPEIPLPSINAKKLRIMRPLLSTSQEILEIRNQQEGIDVYPPPKSANSDDILYEAIQNYALRTKSKVLSDDSLVQFSSSMALHTARMEEQVAGIISENFKGDPSTGIGTLRIDPDLVKRRSWIWNPFISTRVLEYAVRWIGGHNFDEVSPSAIINARTRIIGYILNVHTREKSNPSMIDAANVILQPSKHQLWNMYRAPLSGSRIRALSIPITMNDIYLWDERFYVSVVKRSDVAASSTSDDNESSCSMDENLLMKPISGPDIKLIMSKLSKSSRHSKKSLRLLSSLDQFVNSTPHKAVGSIPGIFYKQTSSSPSASLPLIPVSIKNKNSAAALSTTALVAIPSLNINLQSTRYRIEFSFKSEASFPKKRVFLNSFII